MYFVVTPPGVKDADKPTVAGWHGTTYLYDPVFDVDLVVHGWAGSSGLGPKVNVVDTVTDVLSHEIAEAMTDPFPDGKITVPYLGDLLNIVGTTVDAYA